MRAFVVSPHFDDAVLSLGQWLALHPGTFVATVCTAIPHTDMPISTEYDRRSGFLDAVEAVLARRAEDRAALAVLACQQVQLGFVDGAYQPVRPSSFVSAVALAIHNAVEQVAPIDLVLGPLGLQHPDHVATASAVCRFAVAHPDIAVAFYEELPYRVLSPEVVGIAVTRAAILVGALDLNGPHHASLRKKRAAIRAYESQLWALNRRCCYVPERIWGRVCED